jgi:acetyl esterase/lipase
VTRLQLWSDEIEAMRPEARAAIEAGTELLAMFERENFEQLPRDERVREQRAVMEKNYYPVPEAIEREIAGVPCRVILPEGTPRAIYLHFHGGGMVTGAPVMMDIPNRELARNFGLAVVSADYGKGPERPWPAGPDDGVAVAAWLLEHGQQEFGASRMLIGGESAGGYMAAITALRVRDELHAIDRVDGLNLVFGVYDWGRTPSQRGVRPHGGFDVLTPDGIEFFSDCYLPNLTSEQRRAPEISPGYANLRDLPPSLISVGTADHLLDDSLLLATRATAAGVEIDLVVLPEMPHAFMIFDCGIVKDWVARTNDWFAARLQG